ncbi:hypothetical protein PINS_up006337 [Pythium insidiosum]|nr:hypothetical protein PINS_up006337 [Pythium insidiosum]
MTMPTDVFHDRLQQHPPATMRSPPPRQPPRGPAPRLREDQQWPNPWMRRHWDVERPLDLNKPISQRPQIAAAEVPSAPHARAFRPAFRMDVNALVKSLWTPPKPKPVQHEPMNQPAKLTRHRSGSPPRSVYPEVPQPQRALSSRGHSRRAHSAEEGRELPSRRRAYPSGRESVHVRLEHFDPPRSRRVARRYSPEADSTLSSDDDDTYGLYRHHARREYQGPERCVVSTSKTDRSVDSSVSPTRRQASRYHPHPLHPLHPADDKHHRRAEATSQQRPFPFLSSNPESTRSLPSVMSPTSHRNEVVLREHRRDFTL